MLKRTDQEEKNKREVNNSNLETRRKHVGVPYFGNSRKDARTQVKVDDTTLILC